MIEILCVLAIIGMLAAIILPAFPRSTTRTRLESLAVETAALLKADRSAALRRHVQVTTVVDAAERAIRVTRIHSPRRQAACRRLYRRESGITALCQHLLGREQQDHAEYEEEIRGRDRAR